jgi:hypothetical protein
VASTAPTNIPPMMISCSKLLLFLPANCNETTISRRTAQEHVRRPDSTRSSLHAQIPCKHDPVAQWSEYFLRSLIFTEERCDHEYENCNMPKVSGFLVTVTCMVCHIVVKLRNAREKHE